MNHKALLALVAILAVTAIYNATSTSSQADDYLLWKQRFGFQSSPAQDPYRRLIFFENLAIMERHNSDPSQTYKMGVNQFSAMTDEEFSIGHLSPRSNPNLGNNWNVEMPPAGTYEDIDWTTKKMVSPVKNQGSCGSCWAFSAVGVMESFSLQKGVAQLLSEQQLVDCSGKYGNQGCNGGFNYRGLAYVKDHGITTEAKYPYKAHKQNCSIEGGDFKISQVKTVKGCDQLLAAIQERPVGVSADATNWSRYSSGIFSNCKRRLDHDILLVGVTSEYYKIKNSWGPTWGQQGYIYLALGNTCGICDDKSPYVQ